MTIASLVLPVVTIGFGWLGIVNHGDDIVLPWFIAMFAGIVISLLLGVVVHFWGLAKAFWPTVSAPWVTICGLGIVSGCVTLAVAVLMWLRLYGAA